jgi:phosphohistidine phosphatase
MDLILWRHAQAQDPEDHMSDRERALTRTGKRQARRMAAWLAHELPKDTRILVSPAVRTLQTAQALERDFTPCNELLPGATPGALLQLAGWPAASGPVLIVGHQPTLGQTIARLLEMAQSDCAVKKGALWWLRGRKRDGALQTVVVTVRTAESV